MAVNLTPQYLDAEAEYKKAQTPEEKPQVNVQGIEEVVSDKGYHSGATVLAVRQTELRSYIPEPQRSAPEVGRQDRRVAGRVR